MSQGNIMNKSLIILPIFLPVISYAQLPDQTRIYSKGGTYVRYEATAIEGSRVEEMGFIKDGYCQAGCAKLKAAIPEGFGGLVIGTSSGGAEARANLFRYNIHYSANGSLPLYILATTPIADDNSKDTANKSLLGTDSGLLNIKIADDTLTFNKEDGDGEGVCDFANGQGNLIGGCYLNTQVGIKFIDYLNDEGKSKQLASFYTSAQLSFEFPVSELSISQLTRAGRLAGGFGVSGYYANTDKVEHLFPEFQDTENAKVVGLKKWYASFDAGLSLTIDKQFSISATISKPLVNDDSFETITSINLNWIPDAK